VFIDLNSSSVGASFDVVPFRALGPNNP